MELFTKVALSLILKCIQGVAVFGLVVEHGLAVDAGIDIVLMEGLGSDSSFLSALIRIALLYPWFIICCSIFGGSVFVVLGP